MKAISELEKYAIKNAHFYMPIGYYIDKFVWFYHDKFMQIGKTDNNDEREKWQNLIIPCQIYAIWVYVK